MAEKGKGKVKKIILIILLVLVTGIFGLLVYSGLFAKIEIVEKEMGPYKIAYKHHVGPYQKVGQVMAEVYQTLKDAGIETTRGIGVYYDDPKKTHVEDLRSDVGSIIEKKDYDKIKQIPKDIKILDLKKKDSVVVEFPLKTPLSFMIGVMRVYKKLGAYMEEKKYESASGIMEIYDMPEKMIYYVAPKE